MKLTVIGATGLIGSKVVDLLERDGHDVVAASRASGADVLTGEGLADALTGADGLPESGYMRAKVAQEKAIVESGLSYTIVRATQFHEFAEAITGSLVVGDEVRVPDARIQPIAAADVAAEVARVAVAAPLNSVVNIGGPEKMSFADLARRVLAKQGTVKTVVVVDPQATYFGTPVDETSLVAGDGAVLGTVRLTDWLEKR
jgi:uncharacterized protein YbjT (DUF2867 family)